MFQNTRISNAVHNFVEKRKQQKQQEPEKPPIDDEIKKPTALDSHSHILYLDEPVKKFTEFTDEKQKKDDEEEEYSLWKIPQGSVWKKLFFFYLWPIKALFTVTVPDPKKNPKWFPITFLMCILWIGINSYMVSWMITIIGKLKLFYTTTYVLHNTTKRKNNCKRTNDNDLLKCRT